MTIGELNRNAYVAGKNGSYQSSTFNKLRSISSKNFVTGDGLAASISNDDILTYFNTHWFTTNLKVRQISSGGTSIGIIGDGNQIYTYGNNRHGQLGLGHYQNVDIPKMVPWMKAKEISMGDYGCIIIDLENNVWITGFNTGNTFTQLPNIKAKQVSAGSDYYALIDTNDKVLIFDGNKLQMIPWLMAKKISAGQDHCLILGYEDRVWSFGRNESGQLGLGDTIDRLEPFMIPGIQAKDISAGGRHSLLIDTEGRLVVFGNNEYGQLGLNHVNNVVNPVVGSRFTVSHVHASLTSSAIIV